MVNIVKISLGQTFRVLKEKEIRQFGEYRTKRLGRGYTRFYVYS